jgi:hypothetical protein
MNIKQYKMDQAVNWEHLPDIDTLFQYLERKDLIELSKSCKRYRNQLERRVLENLGLDNWRRKNMGICVELEKSKNYKKILKHMKTDLGSKIRYTRKFTLSYEINYPFAKKFVKLFPNIKSLRLTEKEYNNGYFSERSLITILKGMKCLENVELIDFWMNISEYKSKTQIFPKSLKSLIIKNELNITCYDGSLMIYDTIDAEYKNLYSLSVASDKILQNLSTGMQNLKEVDIKDADCLDQSKLNEFLKANTQLKKININFEHYNEEIIQTILYAKYLEYLRIDAGYLEEIQINTLPTNYSIKHLFISSNLPGPFFQIINACKNLETLEFEYLHYVYFNNLDLSKLVRKINILKLYYGHFSFDTIKEADNLKLFNSVHIKHYNSIENYVEKYDIDKLNNYSFIPPIIKHGIAKLINKN